MLNQFLNNNQNQVVIQLTPDQLVELGHILAEQILEEKFKEKDEVYLTTKAVCDMLGKSKETLWRWARDGYLVPIKIGSRNMYRESDVLKIMEGKL